MLVDSDERVTPSCEKRFKMRWLRKTASTLDTPCRGWLIIWAAGGGAAVGILIMICGYFAAIGRRWGGSDPHEKILVDGQVRRLSHPLHHYSYRDIEDHVQRINRFTSISSRGA